MSDPHESPARMGEHAFKEAPYLMEKAGAGEGADTYYTFSFIYEFEAH